MNLVCLDVEGVLLPEFWQHVAAKAAVPELNLTTRDVKDYRELMEKRVDVCARNGIDLKFIQSYISELRPLPGAAEFLQSLRETYQVILLSDTFWEFAAPLMKYLDHPAILCHTMSYDEKAKRLIFTLRQEQQKIKAVQAFRSLNYNVFASGDAYNDVGMIRAADGGCFFRAPETVLRDFPQYKHVTEFADLRREINEFFSKGL